MSALSNRQEAFIASQEAFIAQQEEAISSFVEKKGLVVAFEEDEEDEIDALGEDEESEADPLPINPPPTSPPPILSLPEETCPQRLLDVVTSSPTLEKHGLPVLHAISFKLPQGDLPWNLQVPRCLSISVARKCGETTTNEGQPMCLIPPSMNKSVAISIDPIRPPPPPPWRQRKTPSWRKKRSPSPPPWRKKKRDPTPPQPPSYPRSENHHAISLIPTWVNQWTRPPERNWKMRKKKILHVK